MNKTIATTASLAVTLAFIAAAFFAPVIAGATFGDRSFSYEPSSNYEYETTDDHSVSSGSYTSIDCNLYANVDEVQTGESVTLTWDTDGVDDLTINGVSVSGKSGSKTYTNLQKATTYVLEGKNSSGGTCSATVKVGCVPPPTPAACKLDVDKAVDTHSASVGDELTYTITVRNSGDANCTGGGVRIFDKVDSNVTYVSHSLSGDVSAGYGSNGVYTASDRMLRFNAHTLTPNESVTITWTGTVTAPSQCGDFVVKNQAKATAKELNNFTDWSYSEMIKTDIDNDCSVSVCDKANVSATLLNNGTDNFTVSFTNDNDCPFEVGATSYRVPVDDGKLCIWQNNKLDCQVRYAYKDITLAPYETREVTVAKPSQCYQIDWYYGVSVEVLDYAKFGDPIYSYIVNAATGEERLYGAIANATLEQCSVPDPVPSCDLFTGTPAGPVAAGTAVTLAWETTDATAVYINNGVGRVDLLYGADGSLEYTLLDTTTFLLTAEGATTPNGYCELTIKVDEEDTAPQCKFFTATPNNLPVGGGTVELAWEVTDATTRTISPLVGTVAAVGTKSVNITESTTFTLEAVDADGDEVSCSAPVAVADPTPDPFTCANNVTFKASDYSIKRGQDTKLSWNVTDADSVSISVINETSFSGSETVSPSSDTKYTLTATKDTKTISCPLTIDVDSGGGGSASPRCDLDISDKKIKLGDSVTIEWNTSNATDVTLMDDRGEVIFTTDDYLSSDKKKYLDDEITVKPTRDTEYTLIAERGSRDDECRVEVEIEGEEIIVLESRERQPLVAGIALSQVPYTGFEAGPVLTFVFYTLLVLWALYITYLLVIRNRAVTPSGSPEAHVTFGPTIRHDAQPISQIVTPAPATPVVASSVAADAPTNLPIGNPVIGFDEDQPELHQVDDAVVTELEDQAHAQKALLSSDAIRYLVGTTNSQADRATLLDQLIGEAKKTYPLEDGWIVINELRMRNLCEECAQNSASDKSPFMPAVVPEGSGSLAEAIVTGNIVAAYNMIGNRPMFALADASADLDSVYRRRQGGNDLISEMLLKETERLSDEQLRAAIDALTSAIDGTYTDEASAVKMAIMKAVKAVA